MLPDYLQELNPQQLDAVKHISSPLLVLAGAGTGKTKVIVSKIAYLIQNNIVQPNQILAVTFTNKAANEMLHRIMELTQIKLPWVGTFHSISSKILRLNAEQISLNQNFTIIDADDQIKLVRDICKEKYKSEDLDHKLIHNIIQNWKDSGLKPESIKPYDIKTKFHDIAKNIYSLYQNSLKKMDSLDFGDIILLATEVFKMQDDNSPNSIRNKFKFIFVDEYQDTNTAQYLWLRMLANKQSVVCCVGDDDQSIYGWRGAKIGNILKFEHDFPNARVIKLEQNYRSSSDILNAASSLISNNQGRYNKVLWTDKGNSKKIQVKSCIDDRQEATSIAYKILSITRNQDVPKSNIAILVRASFQTRIIEDAMLANNIPYKLVGGLKFYERQEIKDISAYLKLLIKTNDDLAFLRIINKPKRGIGEAAIDKIRMRAETLGISLFDALCSLLESKGCFSAKSLSELGKFVFSIRSWQEKYENNELDLSALVKLVVNQSEYLQMLKNEKSKEANSRIENINEFILAMRDFVSLQEYFEHISLISEADDSQTSNKNDAVNIMTLHAAKGLEFDSVFLPGWEDGLFPHQRTIDELGKQGLEEERRLAYVGITRAKKNLFISFAYNRRMYNQFIKSSPSIFLSELPQDCYEKVIG
jgi:DNA helicase-2/ATP-dependent DNA helicase PcrA